MIDATTASTLSTANTSAAATSSAELQESYNSFLTLLTAQISNQDPLNPVDSTQFVSQLAQLTQVEQSIATNASLEQISTMLSTVGAMSDLQLIGRDVLVPSTQVRMTEDEFPLSYQLNAGAEEVTVRIFSEDGTLIREMPGPSTVVLPPIWAYPLALFCDWVKVPPLAPMYAASTGTSRLQPIGTPSAEVPRSAATNSKSGWVTDRPSTCVFTS